MMDPMGIAGEIRISVGAKIRWATHAVETVAGCGVGAVETGKWVGRAHGVGLGALVSEVWEVAFVLFATVSASVSGDLRDGGGSRATVVHNQACTVFLHNVFRADGSLRACAILVVRRILATCASTAVSDNLTHGFFALTPVVCDEGLAMFGHDVVLARFWKLGKAVCICLQQ